MIIGDIIFNFPSSILVAINHNRNNHNRNDSSSYSGSVVEDYVNNYINKLKKSVSNVSGRLFFKEEAIFGV